MPCCSPEITQRPTTDSAGSTGLFVQVLGLCSEAGLVDSGLVAIDGTKMEADASYFANRTRSNSSRRS
jgi:hypothetical protein